MVADCDLRYSNSGTAIANFTIANEDSYKSRDGDRHTNFIDCVAFGKSAEFITNYFPKGKAIIIEASVKQERWEDKDGNKRSKLVLNNAQAHFELTRDQNETTGNSSSSSTNDYEAPF